LIEFLRTTGARPRAAKIQFIQLGKPDQNAFIERFNGTYREEVLTPYLFGSIEDVRQINDDWPDRYNEIRPHDALGSLPPARFPEQLLAAETPL
jgi:putative transposase